MTVRPRPPLLAGLLIAAAIVTTAAPASAQTINDARDLYAGAAYAEALEVLDAVEKTTTAVPAMREALQYRALCLLALSRPREAEQTVTRLVVTETSPRPPEARLSHTFETDDLIVDHTAPEMVEATARRAANSIIVSVRGRDRLSLLDGIEVVFNNNVRETVEQPADGVRDGREESFTLELPLSRVSNATSVEVMLYDAAGNGTAKRLSW